MRRRAIGSVFLLLGTCIGAGMLAIPVASAPGTFDMNVLLLIAAWLIMSIGAFAVLEVNLWHAPGSNLVSMAQSTLGVGGKAVTWVVYLLLMYSLICAYLSGASDIVQALLSYIHIDIPRWLATILALVVLGSIVYRGVGTVDVVTRNLMSVKLIACAIVIAAIIPHVNTFNLMQGHHVWHNSAFMVMATSFGYASIIPTLRQYLNSDRRLLTKVLLAGSLLPLLIYLLWIFAVQGFLQREGLFAIAASDNTNSMLMSSISTALNYPWLGYMATLFISICALTSFLGVSIGLTDFMADGLNKNKHGWHGVIVHAASFLPPLVIVLLAPGIFIQALAYAGVCCVILLIVMPLLMIYIGRYHKKLANQHMLPQSRWFLLVVLAIAIALLIAQFY